MDNDLVQLKIAVAVMTAQVADLSKIVQKQSIEMEALIALYNKGKGAYWLLICLGGVAGALASKLVHVIPVLVK